MKTLKLCECGCGFPAPIATITSRRSGWIKGEPVRFMHGHHGRRGPTTIDSNDYEQTRLVPERFKSMRDANGYVLFHRLVVAESLSRPLRRDEHVHHRNGNRRDNRIENLEITSASEHIKIHRPWVGRWGEKT